MLSQARQHEPHGRPGKGCAPRRHALTGCNSKATGDRHPWAPATPRTIGHAPSGPAPQCLGVMQQLSNTRNELPGVQVLPPPHGEAAKPAASGNQSGLPPKLRAGRSRNDHVQQINHGGIRVLAMRAFRGRV